MREYNSSLACYITGLIKQKQACGYIYDYEAYILESFDRFCIEKNYTTGTITRDLVMQWAIQRPIEGRTTAISECRSYANLHSTCNHSGKIRTSPNILRRRRWKYRMSFPGRS